MNDIFEDELEANEYLENLYSLDEDIEVVEEFHHMLDEDL